MSGINIDCSDLPIDFQISRSDNCARIHVQEWVDSFPDHSPTTTRNYMRCVKRCIKWGQTLGYIDTNPIQHISIPASTPKDVYLTPEEFAQLLSSTPRYQLSRLMLEVTYESGCRPQESLRIEIRHIDLNKSTLGSAKIRSQRQTGTACVYLSDKAIEITRRRDRWPHGGKDFF
jgi:integrase